MRALALTGLLLALPAPGADPAPRDGAALAGAAPRLAVVALDAPGELRFTGKKVADAVAIEAAGSGGFQVMGPEAVERRLGRDGTAALSRCAADAACLAERAAGLGVDRVVGGFLARVGDAYRVAVVHADVRTRAMVARFDRRVPVASRRLEPDVASAVPGLLRGDEDAPGRLTVVTSEPGVMVAIDGEAVGTTPVTRDVLPGSHEVRVWGDGYARADPIWVEVRAGEEVVHRPRIFDIPARDLGRKPKRTTVEVVR
jgi:hypothetical protein